MLEFHTLVELESVTDVENRVESGTFWVVVRCVNDSVKISYEFILLCACDGIAEVETVEVHMGVRRCGSFTFCA